MWAWLSGRLRPLHAADYGQEARRYCVVLPSSHQQPARLSSLEAFPISKCLHMSSSCWQGCLLTTRHAHAGPVPSLPTQHMLCKQRCGRSLACGHSCASTCHGADTACPPCSQPCAASCPHGKCKLMCGEVGCEACLLFKGQETSSAAQESAASLPAMLSGMVPMHAAGCSQSSPAQSNPAAAQHFEQA